MPRDWMDHPRGREPRGEGRDPQARATERDDFGQADFSRDYAYDPESRTAYRPAEEAAWRRDDYGQADYSDDYGYDRARGQGYRRFSDGDRDYDRAADASDAPGPDLCSRGRRGFVPAAHICLD